jgi:hypothetical protein
MDMTEALNQVWDAIRDLEPDLSRVQVSIVPGPGSPHWRPDIRVLHVPQSTVAVGSVDVLGFLLHFAAHDLMLQQLQPYAHAPATGSSRHPDAYRQAAERLHLQVQDYVRGKGYISTAITAELLTIYEPQLRQLDAAREDWEPTTSGDRRSRR